MWGEQKGPSIPPKAGLPSFLGISGALYLDLFEQPVKVELFSILLSG
jgi:hypothetical protein